MKIYLVRHGRTHWNDLGLAQGLKDVPLNEEGINSAKELAKDIKNLKIDKCISSPLSRAKDTAKILVNDKIDIIYDDKVIERSFGDYEGIKPDEDLISKWWNYKLNYNENNIESLKDVLDRANNFLNYLKLNYGDENILIVTYGCFIKALHYNIIGYNENTDFLDFFPKNTTIYEYDI